MPPLAAPVPWAELARQCGLKVIDGKVHS
jgi:hypothetical protein